MENKYNAWILLDSLRIFLGTKQKEDEGLVDYYQHFKSAEEVMRSQVGHDKIMMLPLPNLAAHDPDYNAVDQKTRVGSLKRAYQRFLAVTYMENADQSKYGSVIKNLASQFSLKNDQ